jgi:hypothetical protein
MPDARASPVVHLFGFRISTISVSGIDRSAFPRKSLTILLNEILLLRFSISNLLPFHSKFVKQMRALFHWFDDQSR